LSEIIRAFKTFSSRKVNQLRDSPGVPLWQRNYHERVIRTEQGLNDTRQYILDNPAQWPEDRENPQNW
jgi:putative transposase